MKICFSSFFAVFSFVWIFAIDFSYDHIDIYSPTKDNLLEIQDYLFHGKRPYLKWIKTAFETTYDTHHRYKKVRDCEYFHPLKEPVFKIWEGPSKDKTKCIITYTTFNDHFAHTQEIMIESLRAHFDGDILQRYGGWPDIEGGSLALAHVPYGFKVAFFKEALARGYTKVLWMDAAFIARKNLQQIFDIIDSDGYFITEFPFEPREEIYNEKVTKYFQIRKDEYSHIPQCWTAVVGLDLSSEIGYSIFTEWYKSAENLDPYLSPLPDQNTFSFILYRLGLRSQCHMGEMIGGVCGAPLLPKHYLYNKRNW